MDVVATYYIFVTRYLWVFIVKVGFWTQKNNKRKMDFGKMDILKMSKIAMSILFLSPKNVQKSLRLVCREFLKLASPKNPVFFVTKTREKLHHKTPYLLYILLP